MPPTLPAPPPTTPPPVDPDPAAPVRRPAQPPWRTRLRTLGRRVLHRAAPRHAARQRREVQERNLLPLLIRVLAGFSKFDGANLEEEIDSSLGFLRHDYPEAVYSELRRQFRHALAEQPDLDAMAAKLAEEMLPDRKILLAIQLYDLITRAGQRPEHLVAFYGFVNKLGMAAQAIDIVLQLNAPELAEAGADGAIRGESPLETVAFGPDGAKADIIFRDLKPNDRLLAYRYHDLILIKNFCDQAGAVVVNGRPMERGSVARLYEGQRLVIHERVVSYQEIAAYFNAKKNVAVPKVFLSLDADDEVSFERNRTRDSVLEIRFGLKVHVHALKTLAARFNDTPLVAGAEADGALEDRIVFHNGSELSLMDVRRRARAMGGSFQLLASKSEYLVSNNPSLLESDDILLSPGAVGEVLLKITCDYPTRTGQLEVLQASRPILIGDTPVRNVSPLKDGDVIRLDGNQSLRCNFSERQVEEERNVIHRLEVRDLSHTFGRNGSAARSLDAISFTINRGEMVCVMGASGSGKSTLLKTIAGQQRPTHGAILLNDRSLYDDPEGLRPYVAYIPQDDAFDEQLTIEENLTLAAALRSPHLSNRERARRVDGKLIELGLNERRSSVVGSPVKKSLSGGERKRLNIGLDMISLADVFLFDEPTSGLSSKDSEHVIEIIRGISHNKSILVTIHQPSSKLFQMFHKVILMDKGGRLVFFGTPNEALRYFAEVEHQQHHGVGIEGCPACGSTRPEFIFDVLETPLRDMGGDIIFEENSRGQLVPARRFSPEFWRDKYESHRLLREVRQVPVARPGQASPAHATQIPGLTSLPGLATTVSAPTPVRRRFAVGPVRWRDEWTQIRTLLQRAFFSKLRNRANVLTTIVEAPLLAALIGLVLRYSERGQYDFASCYHIPTYLFLSLIVAMFLGLTNSADDVVRDRVVLQRERNLNIRLPYYIMAKTLTLGLFALVQCVLFLLIGNYILQIRGMFFVHLAYSFLTAFSGLALGLLVSSLVADAKTAVNVVPLILIPQIIMSGALIKYEEMNKSLDFVYLMRRYWSENAVPGRLRADKEMPRSKLEVPPLCQFLPTRWSYEGMVVAQAKLNPLVRRQERIQWQIQQLANKGTRLTPEEDARLDDLKELLAALSGLEASDARGIGRDLRAIDRLENTPASANRTLDLPDNGRGVTAEALFVNQKISDLVNKAEMDQSDYRKSRRRPRNVFFGLRKYFQDRSVNVHVYNGAVLVGFSLVILGMLHGSLRRQLRR